MKILCLLSWKPSTRWLWDYLPDSNTQVDFLYVRPTSDRYPGYGKIFSYYPAYFHQGWQAFQRMTDYDIIVAWEANTALPLALLRSLAGRRQPALFVLNFVLKGRPVHDFLPLARFAMRSVNRITCLSQAEIKEYCRLLDFPSERCTKLQGPFRDYFEGSSRAVSNGNYIFSAGRSHRDYHTLAEAVRDLSVPVIINARPFNVKGIQPADNLKINPFLPFDHYLLMLEAARFVVVPLLPARHASGETFMIQAMTASKAVIASQTFSTQEMIAPGVNGLLVPPGDPQALRQNILMLLDNPELVKRIGQAARQHYQEHWSFPVVARQVDEMIQQTISQRN